jgi:hypothetical protein
MTARELLAQSVVASKELLARFLAGFNDGNRASQAPHLPNHVIWCLGHCALTMYRVAERIDGRSLPETDFVTGDGGAGTPSVYDTESVSFNSRPIDEASRYPTLARGIEVYEAACDRLAEAARVADEATLDQSVPWGKSEITLWMLVARLVFHNGTHTGQIIDLRRALGLGQVLG